MVFFSNVIRNIETYAKNWMQCPIANIDLFLTFKGYNQEDVSKILEQCFSPEELVKIGNTEYNSSQQLAVFKEKINLDITLVIQDSKQFDMTRGLAKNERVTNAQQVAENCITFGEARHGASGSFNFSKDHDSLKTSPPGKRQERGKAIQ